MKTLLFIIIDEAIALQYNGLRRGRNIFNAEKLTDGRWVCSASTYNTFPEIFGDNPEVRPVDDSLFPTPEIN